MTKKHYAFLATLRLPKQAVNSGWMPEETCKVVRCDERSGLRCRCPRKLLSDVLATRMCGGDALKKLAKLDGPIVLVAQVVRQHFQIVQELS